MTDDSAKQRRALDAQVERWTAEAKKLSAAGNEAGGLELYRRAADELPGAPWLQHRTAELARKLRASDVAIVYFRRAATAFQIAAFPKRAVAPLRTAWSLAIDGLPGSSKLVVELALDLMQLHRGLGFAADAAVTFERTNAVLRSHGFSEIAPHALERDAPPSSGVPRPRAVESPRSDVAPRASATPPAGTPGDRGRALGRLFVRRG